MNEKNTKILNEKRVFSLLEALQKLINRLSSDELLETLKNDSFSANFVNIRIQEIIETSLSHEKEAFIEKILKENEFLKEKQRICDENKENLNNNDEMRRLKKKYKRKSLSFREKVEKINEEKDGFYQNLTKKNQEIEEIMNKNTVLLEEIAILKKTNEVFVKKDQEIEEIMKKNSVLLEEINIMRKNSDKSKEIIKKNSEEIVVLTKKNHEITQKNVDFLEKIEFLKKKDLEKTSRKSLKNPILLQKKFAKIRVFLYELTKEKDYLKNLQTNISQNLAFYMLEFRKELFQRFSSIFLKKNHENTRFSSENLRISQKKLIEKNSEKYNEFFQENQRISSENQRISSENQLFKAENQRISSENQRISSENQLFKAENGRFKEEKSEKRNEILQRENTRFSLENQRIKEEKVLFEAKILSQKRLNDAEKEKLNEKINEIQKEKEKILIKNIEEISMIKCEFLKEFSNLHNNLIKIAKNYENLSMKYEEEIGFFQNNYLNDLKSLKFEYKNKLTEFNRRISFEKKPEKLDKFKEFIEKTHGFVENSKEIEEKEQEIEEIRRNLKELEKIADKKHKEFIFLKNSKRNSLNFKENSSMEVKSNRTSSFYK